MSVLIRQHGNLIDISHDGHPLSDAIIELLAPQLQYDHITFLRGADAYDPSTGYKEDIRVDVKHMYQIDSNGFLFTCQGFLPKITEILQRNNIVARYHNISPPRARPNCYIPNWENVRNKIQFRPRQEECLQAMASTEIGGLIDAVTGFGKTFIMYVMMLLYPEAKFAVVVESLDIARLILRRLTGHLPNIGMVGGGKKQFGDRITVYSAGSMHHCNGDVDFLLADEVHSLMSPKHSEKIGQVFRQTRNFGFSATLDGRLDGAGAKLEMFFGPTLFKLTYPEAVALGLVCPIRVRWLLNNMKPNPTSGHTTVMKKRSGIWHHYNRNKNFADDSKANRGDRQNLMLVETVQHAVSLWQHLPDYQLCYATMDDDDYDWFIQQGLLPNGFKRTTPQVRDGMRRAFETGELRKVIATDVWSTGVDFGELSLVHRLDDRTSPIINTQGPGRASRLFDGKEYGEIVDGWDLFDDGFKSKSQQRRRLYKGNGWEQIEVTTRSQVATSQNH